jgi:hypothetical protein
MLVKIDNPTTVILANQDTKISQKAENVVIVLQREFPFCAAYGRAAVAALCVL